MEQGGGGSQGKDSGGMYWEMEAVTCKVYKLL